MRHKVFQRLHQSSLHVTCLGRLDGCIDQTLTTRDSVEEELSGREPRVEAISDKPLGGRLSGLLWEVGERTILEPIWDTMTCNDLLTNASNHLCNVDDGAYTNSASCKETKRWTAQTFGTTGRHDQRCVVAAQLLETDLTDLVADL